MNTVQRYQATKRLSVISGLTNGMLALVKVLIGITGQSVALVADGLHSFSDLSSDVLVLLAAKAAKRAPDADHPYGHRRIETLATIAIAVMLLGIAFGLFYEMIWRLIDHQHLAHPDHWVLITAFISIICNEGLYRYCRSVGEAINSPMILANAWHNRSDALSSLVVLVTAGSAYWGVTVLDPIGAIIIAVFILRMGAKMIYGGFNELIDRSADDDTLQAIADTIHRTHGVCAAHQIRTRLHSGNVFVDCHILVDETLSVSEGHFIGDSVKYNLIKRLPNISDVTVHIDAEDDQEHPKSFELPSRFVLDEILKTHWSSLPGYADIQRYTLHYTHETLTIEIVLPLRVLSDNDVDTLAHKYQQVVKKLDFSAQVRLLFSA